MKKTEKDKEIKENIFSPFKAAKLNLQFYKKKTRTTIP